MKTVSECATLREYREEVLALPQAEIGRRCKRHQAWVSFCERGHLPRAWNREGLLKAYELENDDFVRLVTNAAKTRDIQKPMSETHPLMATAQLTPAEVSEFYAAKLREAQQALILTQELREAREA